MALSLRSLSLPYVAYATVNGVSVPPPSRASSWPVWSKVTSFMRTIPAEPASAPRPMATSPISLRSVCFAAVITSRACGRRAAHRPPAAHSTRSPALVEGAAPLPAAAPSQSGLSQRLLDVGDDIFGRLDTDRE